jgi:hypothetical protein
MSGEGVKFAHARPAALPEQAAKDRPRGLGGMPWWTICAKRYNPTWFFGDITRSSAVTAVTLQYSLEELS